MGTPKVTDCIDIFAAANPHSIALTAPNRPPLSYLRLAELLGRTHADFLQLGLTPSHRAGLLVAQGPETVTTMFSLMRCATCVPFNATLPEAELATLLARARLDCLVANAETSPAAVSAARGLRIPLLRVTPVPAGAAGEFAVAGGEVVSPPREPNPAGLAAVLHTSGTTGPPKRVPLTHANLLASANSFREWLQLGPDDRLLASMPAHNTAFTLALVTFTAGAGICCIPGFYGAQFFGWMDEIRPTWMWLPPSFLQELVARPDFPSDLAARCPLRFIRTGAAPITPQVQVEVERRFGAPVLVMYGMSEAAPQISCNPLPPAKRKPGSVGLPVGPELRIAGADGHPHAPGVEGEVQVRGPNVMAGYEDDPEANRAAFRDGWFRTGDLGYLDDDGYLFLTGRIKEMINRGGEKISPYEIESALRSHPAVAEAAVFPLPHARLGEIPAAAVVVRHGETVSETELRAYAATQLARFQVPARIMIVSEIPKGAAGKIQRAVLAERLGLEGGTEPAARAPFRAPSTDLEVELARLWSEILHVEGIGLDDSFESLGGDSFAATLLHAELAEGFGAREHLLETLDPERLTIGRLAQTLESAGGPPAYGVSVAPVQPKGGAAPFFCIPGAGLPAWQFRPLARSLGEQRPFVVLSYREDPGNPSAYSVEDLAERFLDAMLRLQPQGPYLLGGHCFGGMVAFEIARRLHERGERVQLLALFDTPVLNRRDPRPRAAPNNWNGFLRQQFDRRLGWLSGRSRLAARILGVDEFAAADRRAARSYVPEPYSGRIVHFLATNGGSGPAPLDDRLAWKSLAEGGVDLRYLEAGHDGMFRPPAVGRLAEELRTLLEKADRSLTVAAR